ncbi:MAG: S41 family peptidase [Patescibacteria group bacterium]|nr:S41 family peptidase [Patescibacteria group bacterium]
MSSKYRRLVFLSLVFSLFTFWVGHCLGSGKFNQVRNTWLDSVVSLSRQNESVGRSRADLDLFWKVWDLLYKYHLNRNELVTQDLIYGAISGLTKATGDPYTAFLTPTENEAVKAGIDGEYEGIGAELGMREGQLLIISPLEGSPAEAAGVRAGDRILEIDGKDTSDLTLSEAVAKIRGKAGTEVVLTLLGEDEEEAREVSIVRGTIELESVKWRQEESGIYYVRVSRFGEKTVSEWDSAIREISSQANLRGLVLDLRNNPGGVLTASIEIASDFIDNGVIIKEQFAEGPETDFTSTRAARLAGVPVVVLVNRGSASASEILAVALKYHQGAVLVGRQTFGKGTVQDARDLDDGSGVHITVARWLTPNGTCVEGEGLSPDFEIEIEEQDIEQDRDPHLEKAKQLLRE